MTSPAPDLDELERLRLAVEDPGWVLPITALVPMTQQQTEYASALVNAAPALLQEVRQLRMQSRTMLARSARKYLAVVNERYHGRATWGDVATADADLREILDADP